MLKSKNFKSLADYLPHSRGQSKILDKIFVGQDSINSNKSPLANTQTVGKDSLSVCLISSKFLDSKDFNILNFSVEY